MFMCVCVCIRYFIRCCFSLPESRAVTIATFVKDRVQVLRNSSEGVSNEYDITHERAYFTEVENKIFL